MTRLLGDAALALVIGLALTAVFVGCTAEGNSSELGPCTTVCECAGGLPGQQQACVDQCLNEHFFLEVPPACAQCVIEHTNQCLKLEENCLDTTLCRPPSGPIPDVPR